MTAPYVLLEAGRLAVRVRRRSVLTVTVLLALVLAAGLVGLVVGDYTASVRTALGALAGTGDDPVAGLLVREVRLPRTTAAVLVGAALGVSGALLQTASGNSLGSPDIVGFTAGSATGAVVAIVVSGGTPGEVAVGALAGGLGTAALVFLLSHRRHGASGAQLVLVGVGVGAVLAAVNHLLLVRASLDAAQNAAIWLAGSLNAVTWPRVELVAAATAALLPAAALISRELTMTTLGDDVAAAAGVRVRRVRSTAVLLAVALVSVATATGGPVAFVALAAPQLARRLTRAPGVGVTAAAVMGALLVLVCDLIAQRLFAPSQLPVGVVTGSLGGLYLIWMLARERRRWSLRP